MNKLLHKFATGLLGLFLLFPFFLDAQIFTPYTISDAQTESELIITPTYPQIGDRVTVEVSSFAIDLNNSTISYYKSDQLLASAPALKEYSYERLEGPIEIRVIIETPDGILVEKTKTIIPGSVDIVWEAQSYTPPFYKGKSLYSKESDLHIVAIPTMRDFSGNLIDTQDIVYTWNIDGDVLENESGLGKDTITLQDIFLGSELEISLLASSRNGEVIAQATEIISNTETGLYFYENNPLYGVKWQKALSSVISDDEISLIANPLFFSVSNLSQLNFNWSANGNSLNESSHIITLRNNSGESGLVNINLVVENVNSFFERAESVFRIEFN